MKHTTSASRVWYGAQLWGARDFSRRGVGGSARELNPPRTLARPAPVLKTGDSTSSSRASRAATTTELLALSRPPVGRVPDSGTFGGTFPLRVVEGTPWRSGSATSRVAIAAARGARLRRV